MSQSTPNAPESPQEATEGRQGASEGSSGQRETLKGQNGPQGGAESFDGEQQPRGPVDWARHYADQREQRRRAIPPAAEGLPDGALDSATNGATALDAWAGTGHGRNFLAHALIQLARDGWLRRQASDGFEVVRDHAEAPEPQQPPAHDVGPSVAECAQADDAHWTAKYAGEGQ
jgi:hypothetical protein